jgi:hypothetical protein
MEINLTAEVGEECCDCCVALFYNKRKYRYQCNYFWSTTLNTYRSEDDFGVLRCQQCIEKFGKR